MSGLPDSPAATGAMSPLWPSPAALALAEAAALRLHADTAAIVRFDVAEAQALAHAWGDPGRLGALAAFAGRRFGHLLQRQSIGGVRGAAAGSVAPLGAAAAAPIPGVQAVLAVARQTPFAVADLEDLERFAALMVDTGDAGGRHDQAAQAPFAPAPLLRQCALRAANAGGAGRDITVDAGGLRAGTVTADRASVEATVAALLEMARDETDPADTVAMNAQTEALGGVRITARYAARRARPDRRATVRDLALRHGKGLVEWIDAAGRRNAAFRLPAVAG